MTVLTPPRLLQLSQFFFEPFPNLRHCHNPFLMCPFLWTFFGITCTYQILVKFEDGLLSFLMKEFIISSLLPSSVEDS